MPRGLDNWSYKNVCEFLKEKGFSFLEYKKGSHEAWLNRETNAIVDIDFHASKSFPIRTLETMIRQSGIAKKVWYEWTKH
jgi:predicted RNA binding protein YcfA (HicA-like mRNA interferase family)